MALQCGVETIPNTYRLPAPSLLLLASLPLSLGRHLLALVLQPLLVVLLLSLFLVLLAPLKTVAEDVMIGGVPVPAEAAPGSGESPFLGAWFGAWGGTWRTVLVIETVEDDRIVATYAVGPNGSFKGGNRRLEGRVNGQRATLEGPSYVVDIALTPHGTIRARYNEDQGFAILNRGDLAGDHPWTGGVTEMIETGLTEDGAPVRLKTVIFKPAEGASFPMAVINHGASG